VKKRSPNTLFSGRRIAAAEQERSAIAGAYYGIKIRHIGNCLKADAIGIPLSDVPKC
jgi:hypothetical protein